MNGSKSGRSQLFGLAMVAMLQLLLALRYEATPSVTTRAARLRRQTEAVDSAALAPVGASFQTLLGRRPKATVARDTVELSPSAERSTLRRTREVQLLHARSVEALELIDLFVRYGVMQAPFVRDHTRRREDGQTTEDLLEAFRSQHQALLVLEWSRDGDPAQRLLEAIFSVDNLLETPASPEQWAARVRESVRGLRCLWVAEAGADLDVSSDLRSALRPTALFGKAMRQFAHEYDPTFAELVQGAYDRYSDGNDYRFTEDLYFIETVLDQAEDWAELDGDTDHAHAFYRGAARTIDRWLRSTQDRARLRELKALRERAPASAERTGPTQAGQSRQARGTSPDDAGAVSELIQSGLIIEVPDGDLVSIDAPDGRSQAIVNVVDRTVVPWSAPWLSVVAVDIQLHDPSRRLGRTRDSPVAVSLTELSTGKRHVRRLRSDPDSWDDPDSRDLVAYFIDVERGRYRLDVVSATDVVRGESVGDPQGGGTAIGRPLRDLAWWRVLPRRIWRASAPLLGLGRRGRAPRTQAGSGAPRRSTEHPSGVLRAA